MQSHQAQGTIEYLIIIAIIIVIALVVVGLMSGFLNQGSRVNEMTSKAYWQAQELAVIDMGVDSNGDGKLIIKSNMPENVTITSATIGGVPITPTNGQIFLGQEIVLHGENLPPCTGNTTNYEITINYTTQNGIPNTLNGALPHTSTCAQIESLTTPTTITLTSPTGSAQGTTQNFIFSTSGSADINHCYLIIDSTPYSDYNVTDNSTPLTNETIEKDELTLGPHTADINCSDTSGNWTISNTINFIITNSFPQIQLTSPTSGNYAGSVDIEFSIYDPDGSASDLNALFYYTSLQGDLTDANYIGDYNLLDGTCFTNGDDLSQERTCTYTWYISDENLTGNYYIDINVYDGIDHNTAYASSPITIDNCIIPTNGITIIDHTNLCPGNYPLAGGSSGVIQFGADDINLNCHGSTLIGAGTYGVYTGQRSNIAIQNCNLIGYAGSIRIHGGGNITIQDNNLSGTAGRSNSGITITGTTTDVNVIDNIIHNRSRSINFTTGIATTNLSFLRNDFNYTYNGFYGLHQVFNNLKISDNNFLLNSAYALDFTGTDNLYFSDSVDANITNDNNFYGSQNLLSCGANCNVENVDINQWNIVDKQINFYETGLNIKNSNLSKWNGGGNSIYLASNSTDVNIFGNIINTVTYPISCLSNLTYTNVNIQNNDFNDNTNYALSCDSHNLINWKIIDNNFSYTKLAGVAIRLPKGDNFLVDNSADANIRGNNFTGTNVVAIYLDSNNIIRDLNLNQHGNLAGGIYLTGSNNQVYDNNIISSRAVQFAGSGSDNNVSNNYFYGSYPFMVASNMTQTRLLINNNIFINNYIGINLHRATLIDSNITNNYFQTPYPNHAYFPIYQTHGTHNNTLINFNDFIGTSRDPNTQPGANWNSNFWDGHHPCTDTTPDDGICDTPYSFDGGDGVDNTPMESQIN
jgi:hypothetical protein